MKKLALMLGAMMISGSAYAGNVACTGSYFGYKFDVAARTQGNKVRGDISINVTSPGGSQEPGTLKTSSSNIRPNQRIQMAGANEESQLTLDAPYSNRQYRGRLQINSTRGNVGVDVTCTLTGNFAEDFETDIVE